MDGFLRAGNNDIYTIGYYTDADIPFMAALARHYLVCDRYFASILGPTFPNRMFMWAGQTDRLENSSSLATLPTIFDRLAAAGVSHTYYFNNLPYLGLWGLKYLGVSSPFQTFLTQAAAGSLPAVSFIDPIFTLLDDGTGNDDHPHADIRNGDAFLATIFRALSNGPAWASTVLIINFDEWGGFYEHVAPPRVIAPNNTDQDLVNGQALLGFRVPALVVSPFTRNKAALALPGRLRQTDYRQKSALVDHALYDHTAVLKLIEWRWGLKPLTARDASPQIGNLADAMDFTSPDTTIPPVPNPASVFGQPCFQAGILLSPENQVASRDAGSMENGENEWSALGRTPAVQYWLQHPRFAGRNFR
jgi:phospholipase C